MSDTAGAGAGTAEHLPYFITAPGDTDTMLVGVLVFMALIALSLGVFYLKLHSLPEKMAHHSNHTQMQVVAILGLIALFTHQNIFWIAALLLAAFKFPDYSGMLGSISASLERIADRMTGPAPVMATETASGAPAAQDAKDTATPETGAKPDSTTQEGGH